MKHEADITRRRGRDGTCRCPDCRLPPHGPPAWLRETAVPIWCGTCYARLATEMGHDAAEECEVAFAYGFEKGIIMTMLRPEWAQGFYLKLREYYLQTHTTADLAVSEEEAKETCRVLPLTAATPSRRS
jgi:hypothetical protein